MFGHQGRISPPRAIHSNCSHVVLDTKQFLRLKPLWTLCLGNSTFILEFLDTMRCFSDLPSFTHLTWKSPVLLVLHAQIFHTYFYKFTHFRFSCSSYISLKLRQFQLKFTHFTYSNLAAMFVWLVTTQRSQPELKCRDITCDTLRGEVWMNLWSPITHAILKICRHGLHLLFAGSFLIFWWKFIIKLLLISIVGFGHTIPRLWSLNNYSKTSFEKNCFSAWASTLNMGLINKVDMVCLSPVGYGV